MRLVFITIILLSAALCSTKRSINTGVETERFMQKVGDKSMNWLELIHHGDSTSGTFYGFDKMIDGKLIYYKSEMKQLILTNGNIKFSLTDFSLSEKPFEGRNILRELVVKDESSLPVLLKFQQTFSGVKTATELKLRRTSILHDSKFDELTLIKIN